MEEYGSKLAWAGVGGGRPGSGLNPSSRVCRHCWIPKDDIFTKQMLALIWHINEKKFKFELSPIDKQPEAIQLTVYSGKDGAAHGLEGDDAGGFYHAHIDSYMGVDHKNDMRKLSTTFSLNPASEYEGGQFRISHSTFNVAKVDAAQMICFPSFMEHEVKPVTKGVRASLVFWMHGPDFE